MICPALLANPIQPNFEEHVMTNESKSHSGESGNFASDREKASEAGRKGGEKGGQQSHEDSPAQAKKSPQRGSEESAKQQGGSGNFANNPEKASEAGRKRGEHSHGGR